MTDQELITRIKQRHAELGHPLPPPACDDDIKKAEDLIGFPLPPLLRALYTRVSNGHFVPEAFPLFTPTPHLPHHHRDQNGMIDLYLLHREHSIEAEFPDEGGPRHPNLDMAFWPPLLLPLCDLGCCIQISVDCSKPNLPIIRTDPNRHPHRSTESPSLSRWIEEWLEKKGQPTEFASFNKVKPIRSAPGILNQLSLRDVFPRGKFSTPASMIDIGEVEFLLGLRLPEQLRRLYAVSNGFREEKWNAQYLFPTKELISNSQFLWNEFKTPNLSPFVFFGLSGANEWWGISRDGTDRIIAYHHNMEGQYEEVGNDILELYRKDYAKYDTAAPM